MFGDIIAVFIIKDTRTAAFNQVYGATTAADILNDFVFRKFLFLNNLLQCMFGFCTDFRDAIKKCK